MKIESAVGELAAEYEGVVEFEVIPAEETANRGDEIDLYGFTAQKHGLVGFGADGEVAVKLPGHQYGKEEIVQAVEQMLAPE